MLKISQPPTWKALVVMFEKQKDLMEWYIEAEDLPNYPLDLTIRRNQILLKKFAYRIIEELGEAYENLTMSFRCISCNHGEEAYSLIERYNEELADTWHFMLEILIFSGIDELGMENWVYQYTQEYPQSAGLLDPKNLLGSLLKWSEFLNHQDGKNYVMRDRSAFVVVPELEVSTEPWNMGGRRLSEKILENHAQFAWLITWQLTMAMNCLKIRDWQNEPQRAVNIIQYNKGLMEAFIALVRMMVYTGKTELSIYNSYVIKNQINHERKLKT